MEKAWFKVLLVQYFLLWEFIILRDECLNQVQELFFNHFLRDFLWSQSFQSNKSCLFLFMWETGGWLHAVEDVVVAPLRPKVSDSKAAAGLTAVASVTEWPGQCLLPVALKFFQDFWYQQRFASKNGTDT